METIKANYIFMTVSAPPEGWKAESWSANQHPPSVGSTYAFRCVKTKVEDDGRISATFALIEIEEPQPQRNESA